MGGVGQNKEFAAVHHPDENEERTSVVTNEGIFYLKYCLATCLSLYDKHAQLPLQVECSSS